MRYFCLFIFYVSMMSVSAQSNILKQVVEKATSTNQKITIKEAHEGLVEALVRGVRESAKQASKKGGFNKNYLIRIPFPSDAAMMKETLLKLGMSKQVKQFETRINNTAEIASKEAFPVFLNAIESMEIKDVFDVLYGGDNAATNYLENYTSLELQNKFKPIIKSAIQKAEVTKYWNLLIKRYNSLPLTRPINSDLEEYIILKTIDGLFVLIAIEEKKIRTTPELQESNLLKRVFNQN